MFKNVSKSITIFSLAVLLSSGIAGCKKTTGGGWIPVGSEGGKATFGFQANCDNIEYPSVGSGFFVGHVTGNLQYKDHYYDVKLKGNIDYIPYEGYDFNELPAPAPGDFTSCEMISAENMENGVSNGFHIMGTYEPVPKSAGPGGDFSVLIADDIDCGSAGEDGFAIFLNGGIYDGYDMVGCLGGGNVTVFEESN